MKKTKNTYSYPFPKNTNIEYSVTNNDAHVGPFKGAIDFAVKLDTKVLSPLDGEIIDLEDKHDKYGATQNYEPFANYLTIKHNNGELSQLVHLKKDSVLVKLGDKVKKEQELALTGNSGWMTAPHLHMFVFENNNSKEGFEGLDIQFA